MPRSRSSRLSILALPVATLLFAAGTFSAAGDAGRPDDWPQYRGASRDGRMANVDLPERPGLEVAWKRPLGSGFSGIVAVDGKVLTLFTAGEDDVLAAFAVADGKELWRYRIGEKFPAIGGSSEGPLSTPVVAGGTVYGLGPWGHLFAVRLADGGELWARRLGEDEALQPRFGFTTAPILAGGSLIVQTGGPDGHSITAFDPATGAARWSRADDAVQYQSPLAIRIDGRELVLAVDESHFLALDPANGEVLWRVEHALGAGHALPVDLGGGRVLVNGTREVVAYEVAGGGDDGGGDGNGWNVVERWRSKNALVRSWALPVRYQGHLYGFTGRFLTCVDGATGELVWKSRPPGGRGLILVDDQLAMIDGDGDLVLAAASPEGYRETARVAVFERSSYTAPSFAGGQLFVRDLDQLAAVRVIDAPAASARSLVLGRFGEMIDEIAGTADAAAKLDAYLEGKSLPLFEGDDLVHFVYRGEAEDAAVAGLGLAPGKRELTMERVAGTDVWARSVRLDPAAHRRYRFVLDFGEQSIADPGNPHRIEQGEDPLSELRMPRFEPPAHLEPPAEVRGRLETVEVGDRSVEVYLPPGYPAGEEGAAGDGARYPLLVVNEGDVARAEGRLDHALDHLIGDGRIAPLIAVFVPPSSRNELYDESIDSYLRFLAHELVPALESRFRLHADPRARAILGAGGGGYGALYAAFRLPATFGGAASLSLAAHGERVDALEQAIARAERGPRVVYHEWTENDRFVRDSQELAALLEDEGYEISGKEVEGTPEWFSYAARWDAALARLFPPPADG